MIGRIRDLFAALALAAVCATPALAQPSAAGGEAKARGTEEVFAEQLVERLGSARGALVVVDEALRGKKVKVPAEGASYETVRALLGFFGVELIEDDVDGRLVIYAIMQRNVSQVLKGPRQLGERDAIPEGNRYVSKTLRIEHGASQSIYNAIRTEMGRDPVRAGNVVLSTPEALTVTDLAPNVRRYERMVAMLDRAAPREERIGNLRLDVEAWAVPPAITDALRDRPSAAAAGLVRGAEGARRVASLSSAASVLEGDSSRGRARADGGRDTPQPVTPLAGPLAATVTNPGDASSAGDDFSLVLDAEPESPSQPLAVRISLKLARGTGRDAVRLDLPARTVRLAAGEWTLAYAGDPGFAILIRARAE